MQREKNGAEGEKSTKKNTDICYTMAWPEGPILFVCPSARHYFKHHKNIAVTLGV